MNNKKDCKAQFRLNCQDWEEFKKISNDLGSDASTILRMFVKNFNEEKSLSFLNKNKDK